MVTAEFGDTAREEVSTPRFLADVSGYDVKQIAGRPSGPARVTKVCYWTGWKPIPREDYRFGGLASFTTAPFSSLITSTENFCTKSSSFVFRLV